MVALESFRFGSPADFTWTRPIAPLGRRGWAIVLASLAFFFVIGTSRAGNLPASRIPASGWTNNVGIPGGIPTNYTQYCNVLVSIPVPLWAANSPYYYYPNQMVTDPTTQGIYSCNLNRYHNTVEPHLDATGWTLTSYNPVSNPLRAIGDGVNDDSIPINCALLNCPNGEYVYLPTGTYRINSTIGRTAGNMSSFSIELKGDGPALTKILNYGSGNAIQFYEFSEWNSQTAQIVSGDARGSNSLVLSSLPYGLVPNLYMVVNRLNSAATIQADATYMVNTASQMVKIQSLNTTTNTVTFTPALNEAYPGDYVTVGINPPYRCGVQDLYVQDMSDNGGNNILFDYAQECWIKNVESDNVSRWHFALQDCAGCEIRECLVHDGWSAGGNADYGVGLFQFCCQNLVENNVFYHCRHAMEMEYGGQGNVFGYNADFNPVNSDAGAGLSGELATDYLMGDQLNHGGSMRWNLREGNVAATIKFDGALGASSYNTVFRNQIQRKGLTPTTVANYGSDIQQWNYDENLSGNVYEQAPAAFTADGGTLRRWGTDQDSTTTTWTITNVTNTNPVQVTVANNGASFGTGTLVTITGVTGLTAANVTLNPITSLGDYTDFTLTGINGVNAPAYTGGGTATVGIDANAQATALLDGEYNFSPTDSTAATGLTWASTPVVAAAASAGPIVITVAAGAPPFNTGDQVTITGVSGFAAANVTNATITAISATQFSLNGTVATGNGTGGAVVDTTLPASYYRTTKPAFLGTLAWPAIDPKRPVSAGAALNAAGYRYTNSTPPPTAPYFLAQPTAITVSTSGTATLTAEIDGYPRPTITWQSSLDGVTWTPITSGNGGYVVATASPSATDNVSTLTFASPTANTYYQCVATNSACTITSTQATSPIVVQAAGAASLVSGELVSISGVSGSAAANVGQTPVTTVDASDFSLTGTSSATAGTGGTFSVLTTPALVTVFPVPVVTTTAFPTGTQGTAYSCQITASNTPTSYTAAGLPAGLSISAAGLVSGTPTQYGVFTITLTASSPVGTSAAVVLPLTINPPVPVITSTGSLPTATDGVAATPAQIAATYAVAFGSTNPTYYATGLPAGLSVNSVTGLITGTPTAYGTFTVAVHAANISGAGSSVNLTLVVNPPAPIITTASFPVGSLGVTYPDFATIAATYTAYEQYGSVYSASGLPAGLTLNPANGAISGTPTVYGTFTVTLGATNVTGAATPVQLPLTINPPVPTITSPSFAPATDGTAYAPFQINAAYATSYSASGLPAGLTLNPATGVISGTPTAIGTFQVTLGASDSSGSAATVRASLVVNPPLPVITNTSFVTGTEAVTYAAYPITAAYATGYSATGLPSGLSLNATTGVISGTPTTYGTFLVTLGASNVTGSAAPVSLVLTINPPAPVLTTSSLPGCTQGSPYLDLATVTATYAIPGQFGASFSATGLPAGLTLNPATGVISGTATTNGVFSVTLGAANVTGSAAAVRVSLTVTAPIPVIALPSFPAGTDGSAYPAFSISAPYATGYSASGLPTGLTINPATGVISGTPTTFGAFLVTLGASDAAGSATAVQAVLTVNPPLPIVTSTSLPAAVQGVAYIDLAAIAATYAVPGQFGASFSATGLPPGLTINAATGVISGTATSSGTFQVTLGASNVTGAAAPKTLSLTVTPPLPSVTTTSLPIGILGVAYPSTPISAPFASAYTATGLPAGLTLNAATGVISGTPTVAGAFRVTLGASNITGSASAVAVTLTINPPAPVIATTGLPSGTAGTTYPSFSLSAPYATSFSASGLPASLVLNSTTGVISGIPTTYGTFQVTLGASNVSGSAAAVTLALVIAPPGPPTITNAAVTAAQRTSFSYQILATNGATSFALVTGTLPPGLTLNPATGVISGVPTTPGTYTITASATNSVGQSASTGTIVITVPAALPVITPVQGSAAATAYMGFSYSISASNGPTSYTATGLPAGLTVNAATGLISGTPTALGTFTVTLGATNSGGTGTATLTLVVSAQNFTGVYFGTFSSGGHWALYVQPGNTGILIAYLGTSSTPVVQTVSVNPDGSFSLSAAAAYATPLSGRSRTADVATTITGQIALTGGAVTGAVGSTTLSGALDPGGSAGSLAGYYSSTALLTGTGSTYVIVGGSGTVLALTVGSASADAALGALNANGTFSSTTNTGATLSVAVASNGTLSASLTPASGGAATQFGGLSSTIAATTRLVNLSALAESSGTGANVLTVGFIVSGASKSMLMRGIGPTLGLPPFNQPGVLPNPALSLFNGASSALQSDAGWGGSSALAAAAAQAGAFALPSNSADSAFQSELTPGAYTAQVSSASGSTSGLALAEFYDLDASNASGRLINISARAQVTATHNLTAGIVISGNAPETVLIRGVGPTLAQFGVTNFLAQPQLTLYDANSNPISSNTSWGTTTTLTNVFPQVAAFPLISGSNDTAMLVTLPPGAYTAVVSGVGGTTGVALVEVYEYSVGP